MNVYLLGAGASKSYEESKTGAKLPLANDFFETFNNLDISSNGWVLVGDIINYHCCPVVFKSLNPSLTLYPARVSVV
jgi:hypothetical protein